MAIELKVPAVGESITEVEIGDWLKAEGDTVKREETVVTVESEKGTVGLAAPVAGRVSGIVKKKGQTASVGEVIGYIEADGKADTAVPPAGPEKPAVKAQAAEAPRVMPAASRALAEHNLPPTAVHPTGPGGR